MIVILYGYHTYLVFTSQTTKEHLKKIYKDQPNPYYMHPIINFWNILCRGKQSPVGPWLPHANQVNLEIKDPEPQSRQGEVSLTTCQEDQGPRANVAQTTAITPRLSIPLSNLLNTGLIKEPTTIVVEV